MFLLRCFCSIEAAILIISLLQAIGETPAPKNLDPFPAVPYRDDGLAHILLYAGQLVDGLQVAVKDGFCRMANTWEYVTLTVNKQGQTGKWVVEAASPAAAGRFQGREFSEAANELGQEGWKLVTSFTFPSDSRPNVIFEHPFADKEV